MAVTRYAATEKDWEHVAWIIGRRGVCGLDTEYFATDGTDANESSCVARTKVHIWSLAIFEGEAVGPRGFRRASPVVLPSAGLLCPALRAVLEDPQVTKAVHNQAVDHHTLRNHGIELRGGVNTLALARWVWPDRGQANGGRGWGLDALGEDLLGRGKTESFNELFREEVEEVRTTYRTEKRCVCGAVPCRKRSSDPLHLRVSERVPTHHTKTVLRGVPLESVSPGHVLWERAVEYAARDAVMALELYDLATRKWVDRSVPWRAT